MIELVTEYPYKEENGIERYDLIRHYAVDGNGVRYYIRQAETNALYEDAIDIYPCKHTYLTTNTLVESEEEPLEE